MALIILCLTYISYYCNLQLYTISYDFIYPTEPRYLEPWGTTHLIILLLILLFFFFLVFAVAQQRISSIFCLMIWYTQSDTHSIRQQCIYTMFSIQIRQYVHHRRIYRIEIEMGDWCGVGFNENEQQINLLLFISKQIYGFRHIFGGLVWERLIIQCPYRMAMTAKNEYWMASLGQMDGAMPIESFSFSADVCSLQKQRNITHVWWLTLPNCNVWALA